MSYLFVFLDYSCLQFDMSKNVFNYSCSEFGLPKYLIYSSYI